jgi:hypothetical protein
MLKGSHALSGYRIFRRRFYLLEIKKNATFAHFKNNV